MNAYPGIKCSIVSEPARLEPLRQEWLALLERSATNEPTLTPAWVLTWWKVFGAQGARDLKTALFHEKGRLVGLAPLLRRRYLYGGYLPFQRIELLGTGENLQDEICSDYSNVIAERGAEDRVA